MNDNEPHFLPRVGPSFGVGELGEKRLMVLGEAHYSDHPEDDRPTLTREIIEEIAAGRRSIPYFSRVDALVREAGSRSGQTWESIAFYNYIPGLAGTAARVRPTREMWLSAPGPFAAVLEEVRPTRLLVTGVDLWNSISENFPAGWSSDENRSATDVEFSWRRATASPIRATWIKHPSSPGFSPKQWRSRVDSLLS